MLPLHQLNLPHVPVLVMSIPVTQDIM